LELTVRLGNGQSVAITQAADDQFVVGDAVKILGSAGASRVTRRN
jgi:outer membrane lipoprotein SlyB